jgi:hypothetical protein
LFFKAGLGKLAEISSDGQVAEWSCSGLQSRVRRFDSDPGLHSMLVRSSLNAKNKKRPFLAALFMKSGPGGEIGRRSGLKIRRTLIGSCRFDSGSGHQIDFHGGVTSKLLFGHLWVWGKDRMIGQEFARKLDGMKIVHGIGSYGRKQNQA